MWQQMGKTLYQLNSAYKKRQISDGLQGADPCTKWLNEWISDQCFTEWGFPSGSVVKNLPANAEDENSIPWLGRSPGEGNGNPLQYSLPGKSHGQRSLAGYIVHGVINQSDTIQQLNINNNFIKHLLCFECSPRNWGHNCEPNRQKAFPWYSNGGSR